MDIKDYIEWLIDGLLSETLKTITEWLNATKPTAF